MLHLQTKITAPPLFFWRVRLVLALTTVGEHVLVHIHQHGSYWSAFDWTGCFCFMFGEIFKLQRLCKLDVSML